MAGRVVSMAGVVALAAFVATIPAANWTLDQFGLVHVPLLGPVASGVVWIGLAFVLRDIAQLLVGKWRIWGGILGGAVDPVRRMAAAGAALVVLGGCVYPPLIPGFGSEGRGPVGDGPGPGLASPSGPSTKAEGGSSRSRGVGGTSPVSVEPPSDPIAPPPAPTHPLVVESAVGDSAWVSWYGEESGSVTATGEDFDPDGLTFAHKTMPFGTVVTFCAQLGCVTARCTDRGPFVPGREFDLSRGAFAAIAPLSAGVVDVMWSPA